MGGLSVNNTDDYTCTYEKSLPAYSNMLLLAV